MKLTVTRLGRITAALFTVALLSNLAPIASAQTIKTDQAKKAVERSSNSGRVLETVLSAGDKGIPRELLQNARAIAVFPHVVKAKLLIQQFTTSYGVVCRRLPDGWSYPAYYAFGGAGWELTTVGGEAADLVMLFMTEEATNWLQKKRFDLKGDNRVMRGEVGRPTDKKMTEFGKANLIIYALRRGELAGKTYDSHFFNSFGIAPDNKLNKQVYGIKSSDVLLGSMPKSSSLPEGITAFQLTLARHLP